MPIRKRMPRYRRKQQRRRGAARRGRARAKFSRYHGMKFMKETILKETLTMPAGANPSVVRKFVCDFSDIQQSGAWAGVSAFSALRALYGRYCITGVKWTFIPVSTQAYTGGKLADRVCYAINRDPQDQLVNENDIIRQDDVKFTNSTRKFSVFVKHPKPMIAATANYMLPQGAAQGLLPTQYNTPVGGAGGAEGLPNQVMFTTGDNKWIWLPTRTDTYGSNIPIGSDQYPDHVGLDVVITANTAQVEGEYSLYNVYQTLYLALKEQD